VAVSLQRPFYANGDLQQALKKSSRFDVTARFILAFGIAKGVEHLALHGSGHGNLRPSNVLLSATDEPVLVGYTLSPAVRSRESLAERVKGESKLYCAPEILNDSSLADGASDVYALGMIIHSLFCPWATESPAKLKFEIALGKRAPPSEAEAIPQPFRVLIDQCRNPDPRERPTARDVVNQLQHPSFLVDTDEVRIEQYLEQFDPVS
jgi:serine/threonine protein kinase